MNTTKDTPKPKESPAYLGNTQNNILSNPCMKVSFFSALPAIVLIIYYIYISFLLQEQNLSMKCLEDYDYDKTACEVYFLNYKVCKAFWV